MQERFGGSSGHSVDLMALLSNVQSHPSGSPLLFFSPFPVPGSAGVNLFAQLPPPPRRLSLLFTNPYVFPPVVLIHEVLRFITCLSFSCTLVVPDLRPRFWFWWSLLAPFEGYLLALKGAKGVVVTNNSCRILRNVAFALGFVGVYDYSNLVVFIPPPPNEKKRRKYIVPFCNEL